MEASKRASTGRTVHGLVVCVVSVVTLLGCAAPEFRPADDLVWRASIAKDGVGALDGQSFLVRMNDGGPPDTEEQLIEFHGGRFHAAACDEQEFATATYTATTSGDAISFEATISNHLAVKIAWKGTVRGETIRGTAHLAGPRGPAIDYTFEGMKKR